MRPVAWFTLIVAVLAGGVIAPAQVAGAAVRPAVVLVNQPVSSVCVGKTFTVGVWFQRFSGGSRAYRVAVYSPRGVRVLYKHGLASSAHWRFWKVRAVRAGKYRTVYSGHWRKSTVWTKYRAYTHARRCPA